MAHLQSQMPRFRIGRAAKKRQLIQRLGDVYSLLQRRHQISAGDFPNLQRMQEQLQQFDFSKLPPLKPKLLAAVDKMLAEDIAKLMQVSHFMKIKIASRLC
jgi:Domain of unknown function (DUF5600)